MRIFRQERTNLHPHDAFVIRVWRKRVYVKGWYALIQVAGRAWIIIPNEPKQRPERLTKS